jgi:hypothetical protein
MVAVRQQTDFALWAAAVIVFGLLLIGCACSIHRPAKAKPHAATYQREWKCTADAIDATGKPSIFTCTEPDGTIWTAKKANR